MYIYRKFHQLADGQLLSGHPVRYGPSHTKSPLTGHSSPTSQAGRRVGPALTGHPNTFLASPKGTPSKRQVSKRQVSKRPVSKRLKRQVYKTSALQNVRFTKYHVYKTSGIQNVRSQYIVTVQEQEGDLNSDLLWSPQILMKRY